MNAILFLRFFDTHLDVCSKADSNKYTPEVVSKIKDIAAKLIGDQSLQKMTLSNDCKTVLCKKIDEICVTEKFEAKVLILAKKTLDIVYNALSHFVYSVKSQADLIELEAMTKEFTDVDQIRADIGAYSVELPHAKIKEIFAKMKVLQLKHLPAEADELIIGCGSGPAAYGCGTDPFDFTEKKDYWRNYYLKHLHLNAITVDQQLAVNPHIAARFGVSSLAPILAGRQFKRILVEGAPIGNTDQRVWFDDVVALLKDDGVLEQNGFFEISKKELIAKGFEHWSAFYTKFQKK